MISRWGRAIQAECRWWEQGPDVYSHFSKDYWTSVLNTDGLGWEWFRDRRILEVGSGPFGMIYYIEVAKLAIAYDPLLPYFVGADIGACASVPTIKICGKGEESPFADDSFDIVICYNVLDHTENPERVLEEISRVLVHKGLVYVSVNTFHPLLLGGGGRSILNRLDNPHPYHFSYTEVRGLLVRSGLEPFREVRSRMGSLPPLSSLMSL
jgi:SAM-dependent methyltransferase